MSRRPPDLRWRLLWPEGPGEWWLWIEGQEPQRIQELPRLGYGDRGYLCLDALPSLVGPGRLIEPEHAQATTLEPPEIQGWRVQRPGPREHTTIRPGSVWGLSRCPEEAAIQVLELDNQLQGEGLGRHKSPAGAAVDLALQGIRRGSLLPRYREICRAAVCSGPTLVCQGDGQAIEEWDLRRAYLEGLRGPLPIAWSWRPAPGRPWSGLTGREGVATVSVYLPAPEGPLAADVHPLPTWYGGQRVYATGHLVGTWLIAAIDWAVAHLGAEVLAIHDAALCAVQDAGIAERIEAVAQPLQRLLYTRLWGRALCLGHWEQSGDDEGERLWSWAGGERLGDAKDPFHRPDIAAYVTGRVAIWLAELACQLYRGELVAAHVDALWIEWHAEREALPEADWWRWARKAGPAPGRWTGIGTYEHGGVVARQGVPWWNRARLPEVSARALGLHAREWGAPLGAPGAWSRQRHLDAGYELELIAPATDPLWDQDGYPLRSEWREHEIPARVVRAGEGPAWAGKE